MLVLAWRLSPDSCPSNSRHGLHLLPKQIEYSNTLHQKPTERPSHQNEQYPRPERHTPSPFLASREEEEGPLGAEEECNADQEQDVAHCQECAVKEEDQAEEEEENACDRTEVRQTHNTLANRCCVRGWVHTYHHCRRPRLLLFDQVSIHHPRKC